MVSIMSNSDRRQQIVERIQEDERLRGDLAGEAAMALVQWAVQRAEATIATSQPDEVVDTAVTAIRSAARSAARSGATTAQEVIAQAEAELKRTKSDAASGSAAHPDSPASGVQAGTESVDAPAPIMAMDSFPTPVRPHPEPHAPQLVADAPHRRRRRWRNRLSQWIQRLRKER
jgi:hypothetical protein